MVDTERKAEQQHLDLLYTRLDELRVRSERALAAVRMAPTVGTPGARSERDAFIALHASRLSQLRAVEERLCFGRLDLLGGERRYVGRIGLSDEEHRQLLLDWRAPAAEPFYRATAVSPAGVVRRRQLGSKARQVTSIEDEVLDLEAYDVDRDGPAVAGEGALMVALDAARTGKMRDIVGTIQAEQDRVIRAPVNGVLVVQGAPGTGKTAVALHRTAYLLYTYRDRVASAGVLVVGPNERFLRYIDAVLPALGEADATVLATPGRLYPGVDATGSEGPAVAAVKGDLRMVTVLSRAVRDRQQAISEPVSLTVDGSRIMLRPHDVRAALDRARRSGKPHNQARVIFVKQLLGQLAGQLGGSRDLDQEERAARIADLRESRDVRRELNGCWPPISPERLLRDLYAQPWRLESAGRSLSTQERALLRRDRAADWTPGDVPLLDEAAELLGDAEEAGAGGSPSESDLDVARRTLEDSGAAGMMSAEQLAARWSDETVRRSVAEHAETDREWTYGHVVVDEAQELAPMAWRLLMRRCPTRSMTIVGDLAQTGALGGVSSWSATLRPYVGDRATIETLTVNYRTPAQLMALAVRVLRAGGVPVTEPTSARTTEWAPVLTAVPDVLAAVAPAVKEELDLIGPGTLGVLCPRALLEPVAAAVGIGGPDADRVSVLTVEQAKGLEFDGVLLLEPAAIVSDSPRGVHDLYVAITRPTQRLHVLHATPLPPGFEEAPQGGGAR
ncbi:MAG TPA: AAA family ATPase [Mycobacteriales bacterium]|nr:AAA family ATPase [Mycobacteriales bacterium]